MSRTEVHASTSMTGAGEVIRRERCGVIMKMLCGVTSGGGWIRGLGLAGRSLAILSLAGLGCLSAVGQEVPQALAVESAIPTRPGDVLAVEGVGGEAVVLDPDAGFGNIAADSFFAESEHRARVTNIRAPGKFGGWTVDVGDVGLHINDFAIPNGFGNAVDLNGTRSGSMFQSIPVKVGVPYRIQFLMSGNWTTNPGRPRTLTVRYGNEKATFTMNKPAAWSVSNMQWESKTIEFTAQRDVIGLRFSSDSAGMPDGPVICQVQVMSPLTPPGALDSIPVPLPPNLADFVVDRDKAIALGKALFWDMQVGSDNRTACASCHWNAGADIRTMNTLHPGASGGKYRGSNKTVHASDFPFHRLANSSMPEDSLSNPVVSDTSEILGSQGVVAKSFLALNPGSGLDFGVAAVSSAFSFQGVNIRQVTGRNAPSTVNAIYFDRSFWDGRANRYFNGVNPFGELDANASVLKVNAAGALESVKIRLDNAALASQAVGPPNSNVEMAWSGRSFAELGRKLFSLRPLDMQAVAVDDSVLWPYRDASGKGLDAVRGSYASLIRQTFRPEWWSGKEITADGYTQMEANFSLFWGLAIMMYESTLISDETPYDRYARGDATALTATAKEGLRIFMQEGQCINCHHGPEFAGATVSTLRGVLSGDGLVSLMPMRQGLAWYDEGFYNIGVRPTAEDLGVGAAHPLFGPLSYSRQEQAGRNPDPQHVVTPGSRVAVDGAFKSPTLRNVELTGPYMHNGGMKSLTEVVQFYTRGGDFRHANVQDLAPDVNGIDNLQGNPVAIAAVVEFMEHLTDQRVKYQRAPFDHPELVLPDGHGDVEGHVALDRLFLLPATGRNGGAVLKTFVEALESGPGLQPLSETQATAPAVAAPVEPAVAPPAIETPAIVPAAEVPEIIDLPVVP